MITDSLRLLKALGQEPLNRQKSSGEIPDYPVWLFLKIFKPDLITLQAQLERGGQVPIPVFLFLNSRIQRERPVDSLRPGNDYPFQFYGIDNPEHSRTDEGGGHIPRDPRFPFALHGVSPGCLVFGKI